MTKEYPLARKYGREAMRMHGQDFGLHLGMAFMYGQIQHHAEAAFHAQQACQINPTSTESQQLLQRSRRNERTDRNRPQLA